MIPASQTLPTESVWVMVYAAGGFLSLLLIFLVFALWRILLRALEEQAAQNKKSVEMVLAPLAQVYEAVVKVESAIRIHDANNQAAEAKVSEAIASLALRLERTERFSERLLHQSVRSNIPVGDIPTP